MGFEQKKQGVNPGDRTPIAFPTTNEGKKKASSEIL
jgi:hypothetical protein